jgi:4-hydroxybenzoate polyprenyltransferase
MPTYSEQDLQEALADIQDGMGLGEASRKYMIPKSTLHGRLHNARPRAEAFERYQALSKVQEDRLAQFIQKMEALGNPLTHAQIRHIAQRILDLSGSTHQLGKDWATAFIRRNPSIGTKRARRMENSRVTGATRKNITEWFKILRQPEFQAIKPENRWNMDESGIMEGQGSNGLVLGSKETRAIQRRDPGSRAWTSFIECISATGKRLPPLVIFKGKSVQAQWFPRNLEPFQGWKFTATEKGWTDDDTCHEWMRKIFLPCTRPDNPNDWRLIILDGHGSHATDEIMWECYINNVLMLFLPPHTSHVLQPLDLAVFSALKRAYRKQVNNLLLFCNDTTVFGKRSFLEAYRIARDEAVTEKNAKSGWYAGGLWPLNLQKPLSSPLLVDDKDQPKSQENESEGTLPTGSTSPRAEKRCPVPVTPAQKKQLREWVANLQGSKKLTRSQRRAGLAILQEFDKEKAEKALLQCQLEAEAARRKATKVEKRRKVEPSLNERFASIVEVQKAKIAAGHDVDALIVESEVENRGSVGDCIVVSTRRLRPRGGKK